MLPRNVYHVEVRILVMVGNFLLYLVLFSCQVVVVRVVVRVVAVPFSFQAVPAAPLYSLLPT